MLIDFPTPKLLLSFLLLAATGLVMAGCASDGPGKAVAEAAGIATTPQESKPFVKENRLGDPDYIPVGSAITRDAKRKPVAEFKTLETELEAKRLANEAAGTQAKTLGATPPPKPAIVPTN
jgi:hypothetical protein